MTERQKGILKFMGEHPGYKQREVAEALGFSRHAVRRAIKAGKYEEGLQMNGDTNKEETASIEISDSTTIVTTRSANIKTLEAALAYAKVDLNVWEVDHHIINFYETTMKHSPKTEGESEEGAWTAETTHQIDTYTNCQVKVWLRRIIPKETEDALEKIIQKMGEYAPSYPMIKRPSLPHGEKFLYEVAVLADPHIARMSWGKETGVDWDTKIATSVLINATDELLLKSKPYPVERILIPIGNDTFEINDPSNTTPRNHNALYVDGRYINVFERGYDCVREMVDHCLEIAPVTLMWIPGNHDPQTSYHLVRVLEEHYSRCKDVVVDRNPPSRKGIVYGPTFLGFTHGCDLRQKDVAAIFMSDFREQIAKCKHIEVHLGHTHQSKETRTLFGNTEIGGVRVRVLQSLSALSNWEYDMGFTNFQAGEAFLWSSINGYAGHFSVPARLPKHKDTD